MNSIIVIHTKLRSLSAQFGQSVVKRARGQTMTEYALILAAVAIVAYVTYQTLGTHIVTLLQGIVADLTPPSGSS